MSFQKTGKITHISEVQTGTSERGEWKKITFVIETDEQYNNLYAFTLFGKDKVDNFVETNKKDDVVEVGFNIQCREWEGRYFTDLQAWKISSPQTQSQDGGSEELADVIPQDDDLPF